MLTACGKKSRFDRDSEVDVCGIVSPELAARILGPLVEPPQPGPPVSGIAGSCVWQFNLPGRNSVASLSATLTTQGSNAGRVSLEWWFSASYVEMKASIDAHPVRLEDVGDTAWLYEFATPGSAQILMQQSRTYAILRIDGASSAPLKSFARELAAEAARKKSREE
jgi:hypothetical protein